MMFAYKVSLHPHYWKYQCIFSLIFLKSRKRERKGFQPHSGHIPPLSHTNSESKVRLLFFFIPLKVHNNKCTVISRCNRTASPLIFYFSSWGSWCHLWRIFSVVYEAIYAPHPWPVHHVYLVAISVTEILLPPWTRALTCWTLSAICEVAA